MDPILSRQKCYHTNGNNYSNIHDEIFNTLRPKQNGRHFADDILKCILLNENGCIPNNISLKFVPKGTINNNTALVQVMAWRHPGDKPLSEPMIVRLLTHICVTRPQWVKNNVCKRLIACLEHIVLSLVWISKIVFHSNAVHKITDNIKRFRDKRNNVIGIFIDFTNAFDTVDHGIMLRK